MLKKMIGFIKNENFFGFFGNVVAIDFKNNKVVIEDKNGKQKIVDTEDVIVMEEVFKLHDRPVFDKDVLKDELGNKYLVNLHDNGRISFDELNDNLEIIKKGVQYEIAYIAGALEDSTISLIGNLYELRKEPNFNINVVKEFNGKHYVYYIAINDKKNKSIDLINIGALINGEEYKRKTISYQDFMSAIFDETLKEVSKDEFNNYVTGTMYKGEILQSNVSSVKLPIVYGVSHNMLDEKDESLTNDKDDKQDMDSDKRDMNRAEWRCEFCDPSLPICYCKWKSWFEF